MTRSPDSQIPSGAGQPATEKRDDKAFDCRQEGEANLRAATLYMWPREKACRHVRQRVCEVVRSFPSNGHIGMVIQKLNPILNGCCTYFRVGNSNRTFHKVDWVVRSELQLWLRRKHQCPWRTAQKRCITFFMADVGCIEW